MTALGPVDYAIWSAVFIVELASLGCLLKKKAFLQHFTIFVYLCSSLAVSVGRYSIIKTSGIASNAYLYFYSYSDALLTICLYFILMSLYAHVFSDMGVSKYVRGGAMLLLAGTSGVSYHLVAASTDRLVTDFVFELGQNLYFVGVLLTFLLWGAMVKLRENRTRLMQLVLSMGVYLSLFAASFALVNLYSDLFVWRYFFPLIAMWLPVSWAYTFLKVPEDARIVTARVLAPNR